MSKQAESSKTINNTLFKCLEPYTQYFPKFRCPPSKPSQNEWFLLFLALWDISRLRKRAFYTKNLIKKELPHLVLVHSSNPSHYPKYLLAPNYSNILKTTVENIKAILAKESLIIQKSNFVAGFKLMFSDHAFNQVLKLKTFDQLASYMQQLDEKIMTVGSHSHPSTKMESAYYMKFLSCPTDCGAGTFYTNVNQFFCLIPEAGTRQKLLYAGEFSGKVTPMILITSLSDQPRKEDRIKTSTFSSFYKKAINHSSQALMNSSQVQPYHYHLKPGSKERFLLRQKFPEGYLVASGMYKLSKDCEIPMELVDIENYEFNAVNYVKSMMPPLKTQQFLEEFDGHGLLKILESIPNFTYAFSEQQRELISSHHNTVVVGRSGTGKTTCAVMRMIGIRLLEIANQNIKKGINRIRYVDLCDSSLFH